MPRQNGLSLETASIGDLEWVLVSSNQKRDVAHLVKKYGFHPLDMKDVLPPVQRPRIVEREDYIFLILTYPIFDRKTRTIRTAEVDFFISEERLVTVNADHLAPIEDLFEAFKDTNKKKERVNKPFNGHDVLWLLSSILTDLEESMFPMLIHLSNDVDTIENRLFRDYEKNLIQELLRIKMNIVTVRKAIQGHKNTIRQLAVVADHRFGLGKLGAYYDRLVQQTKEVWDALDVQKDTINALHETNASLIDFRINEIMKTLTIISVIVFPLTLFAAVFGMNTASMPIVGSPYGFWIIISMMAASTTGMLFFFKHKKWL